MVLTWLLFGALLGVAAAQKRGFSMVSGVIGGMLLGPLAFLMFFVSTGDTNHQCPCCAEFVRLDATVCKHCHRDIPSLVTIR